MTTLNEQAHAGVAPLMDEDVNALFAELGKRVQSNRHDPATVSSFQFTATESYGGDLADIGRKFFANLKTAAANVLCGNGDGHQEVQQAVSLGENALAAAIAAALVAHLALAAAIAAAVAAIIVKLMAQAGGKTFCDVLQGSVPTPPTS